MKEKKETDAVDVLALKRVKEFGGSKVLLHFGGGSVVKSGLLDRIKKSLEAKKIEYIELGGVHPNPLDTKVYEGINIVRKNNIDFILAVGGGSVIDSSKAIALGAKYDGDFWDFYAYKAEPTAALPVGTVLTIAAAGSEGSPDSVITKKDGMVKRGFGNDLIRPRFSVLNPALTQTLPAYQTACGATDIMAHVFERYFTNTKNVETTDRLCEVGGKEEDIPTLVKNFGLPKDGKTGGFVELSSEDIAEIYRLAL